MKSISSLIIAAIFGLFISWIFINFLTGCGEGGTCTWPLEHKSVKPV